MKKIYALQLSNFFPSASLPQAMGSLLGYVFQNETIKKNFLVSKTFWENETSTQVVSEISSPDVLLCSCYIWNWKRTYKAIRKIREKHKNCLIIVGGPEPEYSTLWMKKHPEIDLLIPYYGEQTLENTLIKFLEHETYENIPGTITKKRLDRNYSYPDFNKMISPFLNGYFNHLLKNKRKETTSIRAIFETNRGCPYSCTFCDVGAKQYNRINAFDFNKSLKELEWIVKNNIDAVDVADANFGILPRDEKIVDRLIELKNKLGWHGRFLPTWSKKKGERIIKIAKKIVKNNLDSIFGLSLQSFSHQVLENIKRKNPFELMELSEIVEDLKKDKIPIYTEVIFPLPGESFVSFKEGLHRMLDMKYVFDKFQINQLSRYNNTLIASKNEQQKHQIEWVKIRGFTRHYYGNNSTDEIAVSTGVIDREDVFEGLFYSKCFIIPLYFYGVIRHLTDDLYTYFNIPRSKFLSQLYKNLATTLWFQNFKHKQYNHYFDAISGHKQFGQRLTSDQNDYFPEFSISHQFYLNSPLYEFLLNTYPQYSELIHFSRHSIWTNKACEETLIFKSNEKKGKWIFGDDREIKHEKYLEELYILGRFDQRWRKKIIERVEIC